MPVIWVTNRIEQIDPAFRRRFQYHLELKRPPPGAREALVARALAGIEVGEGFAARLAERRGLTPAQIRTAVRFARLARPSDGVAPAMEALIERQLGNADRALGQDAQRHAARGAWSPPTTCRCSTSSRTSRYRASSRRCAVAATARCVSTARPAPARRRWPSTSRRRLQRPLMVRQASDLVSKYVGETEQNMAKMFEEAQTEGAVLLLDEADSFLRSRQRAERNYEVTEVNEMLQGMERFAGLFICTTNLFDELDEAALRRFTFKVRFKPLTAEQRGRMFVAEALRGRCRRA